MNYVKYLKDARLLNLLYLEDEVFPKKPKQIYAQNTNLMHVINQDGVDREAECKTFFYNALHSKHKVNLSKYQNDFLIDLQYHFRCEDKLPHKYGSKQYYAVDNIKVGTKNEIPLWLFGFLY
jgi:hypothetical protein